MPSISLGSGRLGLKRRFIGSTGRTMHLTPHQTSVTPACIQQNRRGLGCVKMALLISALVSFLRPEITIAATICVYISPSDLPPEHCDKALPSLVEATSSSQPGDQIVLGPGIFRETMQPGSGTAERPLIIRGTGVGKTIISGADPVVSADTSITVDYNRPCSGCGQVTIAGVEVPRLRWPLEDLQRFATSFDRVLSATVEKVNDKQADITFSVVDRLPQWEFVGGRIGIEQNGNWLLLPGRILAFDRPSGTIRARVQFSADRLHVKSGDRVELYPVGPVRNGPSTPYWTGDGQEKLAYIFVPNPRHQTQTLELKKRQVGIDLTKSSNVVVDGLTIRSAAVRTGDQSHGIILRNIAVEYGISRLPTELTTSSWAVEGDYEASVELRGENNQLLNSTVEDSMGNGVLVLGRNNVVRGNAIYDVDRAGLELAGISFGPNVGSSGHLVQDNVLLRAGRHMINHRGLNGGEISGNLIGRWGLLTDDTGGTYTNGHDCKGTRIVRNWLEGSSAVFSAGVYFDDNSSGCIAEENVVLSADFGIWLSNTSAHHVVRHNFAVGRRIGIGIYAPHGQQIQTNGSDLENNDVAPSLMVGPDGARNNRTLTDDSEKLRSLAEDFGRSNNFPSICIPVNGPPK